MGFGDYLSVTVHGNDMVAARDDSVVISNDAGQTWFPMGMPTMLTHIHRVVFSPDGTLWLGAREGVYFTRDLGKTWMWISCAFPCATSTISATTRLRRGFWSARAPPIRSMPSTPKP